MSSENEDGRPLDKDSENSDMPKKPKLSYSREFLLSLSNLDSCKNLPSGFDELLISELKDPLVRVPDQPRIPGTFHGSRRSEYGVPPPGRGDGRTYSRSIHGKLDSRSSLRGDRDSDSQSDKDSDSGRHFDHQNRRSWQNHEHDGLLGSGSFPRPPGYAAGVPAPKLRVSEHNQLNKSNEPYRPPRPYKAVPHSRRDTDSINDETFGSMGCTSEDRAEAEMRRRASFEVMRKEQQKALQDKQKPNLEKHKDGVISDLCEAFTDGKEEKRFLGNNNNLDISGKISSLGIGSEKPNFTSHSPVSRPLVPPGFKSNTMEKGSGSKSLVHPLLSQAGKSVISESLKDSDTHLSSNTNSGLESHLSQKLRNDDKHPVQKMHPPPILNKWENANLHVSLGVPAKKSGEKEQLFQTFNQDSHANVIDPVITELNPGLVEDTNALDSNKSSSVLEKILGSTLSVDGCQSTSVEFNGNPEDTSDIWCPNSVKSSKFVQWFSEEEANAAADVSSSTPIDLLSLIVSGDKVGGVSHQVPAEHKDGAVPAILTCEDLEQSILLQYNAKTTHTPPSVEGLNVRDGEKPDIHVDKHASIHLLSMLKSNAVADIDSVDNQIDSEQGVDIAKICNKHKGEENMNSAPNSLTLETLFGTAFMKELQSAEAPVSLQRGSTGPARVDYLSNSCGLPFSVMDSVHTPSHDRDAEYWPGFGEDTLLSTCHARDPRVSTFMSTDNSIRGSSLSSNATIGLEEELGMENSGIPSFPFNSYEKMEAPFRDMQMRQSSPRFQLTAQTGPPLYNHVDPHFAPMGSRSIFLGQDPVFDYDPHTNNRILPPPNVRVAGFDIPSQHMLMNPMQMPGYHPPHFPRGFPVEQNANRGSRFVSGVNRPQGIRFGPNQPNTGGRGMPIPDPTEAFQRHLEMELRSNSHQIHSFGSIHHPDVMHG